MSSLVSRHKVTDPDAAQQRGRPEEWYKGGEWAEIGLELAAMGLSAGLKELAERKGSTLIRKEVARMTADIERAGGQAHHLNPLKGHPGGSTTLFPTGGLPESIHSNSANLELMSKEAHLAAHRSMRAQEDFLRTAFNPGMTAGRALRNIAADCGCK